MSAFGNLPPLNTPLIATTNQFTPLLTTASAIQQHTSNRSGNFNDDVLNTLTAKNSKKSNCESIKFTKRTIQQSIKNKKLIISPLIVISAHPAQRKIVECLKAKLNLLYQVWSSLDIDDANLAESKDEVDRSVITDSSRYSASLNSLSSSVTNSVDTDQELNYNSNLSIQNFTQIKQFDDDDPVTKLERQTSASIDLNHFNQTVSCFKGDKTRFDKCFYRNQMTSRKLGKSQWYIESSDNNSQSCILQPDEIDKVNIFKEKVNEARIVIILLSENYIESRTSKRQFFYCDFRKQILPINLEEIKNNTHWVSKLLDNEFLIQKNDCYSEIEMCDKVSNKLCTIFKTEEKLNCKVIDLKAQEFAAYIQKKLIIKNNKNKLYIYVMGSTKFKNPSTKELCVKIGRCLAKKEK